VVEAVPEPLARQAAEPRAAQVEQVNLLRCKQAAHKRMVVAAVATEQSKEVVVPAAAAQRQQQQVSLVLRTQAAAVVVDSQQSPVAQAVQAAQGSSWCERSSVALLRVS